MGYKKLIIYDKLFNINLKNGVSFNIFYIYKLKLILIIKNYNEIL